jgi:tetratricopeptide (TPR) repeat protein
LPRQIPPSHRSFTPPRHPFIRRLTRMSAGQLAVTMVGMLVTCSLIAGSLSTVWLDATGGPVDQDPGEFADRTGELIEEQRQRIEENPQDAAAMVMLAALLANDGQISEATRWYERALEIDPNDVQTRLSFARQLALNNRPNDAEIQYQRALEYAVNPADRAQAQYGLAQLYERWDPPRIKEAIDYYQQVASAEGELFISEQARERIAMLLATTPAAVPSPDGV